MSWVTRKAALARVRGELIPSEAILALSIEPEVEKVCQGKQKVFDPGGSQDSDPSTTLIELKLRSKN